MANLAIRGHKERSKEVIELLQILGGNNVDTYSGSDERGYYFINEYGDIDWFYKETTDSLANYFTLEQFLEKFPYKIGDEVTLGGWRCTITNAYWNEDNKVVYLVKGVDFSKQAYSEDLQPYNEQEIINRSDQISNKELQDLLKQFPDDAIVAVEYCNIRELRYIKDRNLIVID